jgi:transmembrane sensor
MDNKQRRILEFLLTRYLDGRATIEQEAELFGMVDNYSKDPEFREVIEELWEVAEPFENYNQDEWDSLIEHVLAEKQEKKTKGIFYIKYAKYAAAAAVIALMVFVGKQLWVKEKINDSVAVVHDVQPGKVGAILKLSDGREVLLDTASNGTILNDFNKKDGAISIQSATAESATVEYATLETPLGRTMQLTLADGTEVWLNAGSSIRFPTAFKTGTRMVTISGEAYFEVAKDKNKPFVVETRTDKIEVLGTHFNVNTYVDEGNVKTTLLEGSVKVGTAVIRPGEQYEDGKVNMVNTEQVVAWKNGAFSFDNADIQMVMRQLARWYDVEVKYEGGVPEIRDFKGEIGRGLTLAQVLKVLAQTRVHYRIEGKTLTILP